MTHLSPAAAQYAASEAPVFPLDVATQRRLLFATMCEIAAAAKRSLYDPVGLTYSSLKYSFSSPSRAPSRRDRTSGVPPSPSDSRASGGTATIRSAKRQMLMPVILLAPVIRRAARSHRARGKTRNDRRGMPRLSFRVLPPRVRAAP